MRTTIGAAGIAVGLCLTAGGAGAAPTGAGLSAVTGTEAPVTDVQFGFGYGPGYGPGYGYYGGPRPYYGGGGYGYGRGYGAYGGGYGYRRRVVCRIRPTPYGPREVCFRR